MVKIVHISIIIMIFCILSRYKIIIREDFILYTHKKEYRLFLNFSQFDIDAHKSAKIQRVVKKLMSNEYCLL